VYHRWSLGQVIGWWWHGITQKIKYLIPGMRPSPEWGSPPDWWFWWYTWGDWYGNLDWSRYPNSLWIQNWTHGAWRVLGTWVEEVGYWARDEARNWTRTILGWSLYGFGRFEDWINNIWLRLGTALPWWAWDAVRGLQRLYDWLPAEIRSYGWSWNAVWERTKSQVRSWALARYDEARRWVYNNRGPLWDYITTFRNWRNWVRGRVDWLVNDPVGFITHWLGWRWNNLVNFVNDPVGFVCGYWGLNRVLVFEFFDHPLLWLWDRVEAELVRRW
jgi:hypothetical protein